MSWGQGSWPASRDAPPDSTGFRIGSWAPLQPPRGRGGGRAESHRCGRQGDAAYVRRAAGGMKGAGGRPQARSRLPRGRAASAFPGVAGCGSDPWPTLSGRGARGRGRGSGGRGGRWGRGCSSSRRSPATAGGGAAEGGGAEGAGCRRGRFWKRRERRVSG